jgi:hypothetical protein
MPDDVAIMFNAIKGNATSNVQSVVNYTSGLDHSHQQTVVNSFTADGNISYDEGLQSKFLGSLPLAEQLKIIDGGNVSNFDLNGDKMSNYFEHNIANLSYADHPTGRYALIVDTDNAHETGDTLKSFLINQEHFKPDNVIELGGTNATISNFNNAVSDLSHKVGLNDFLYMSLGGIINHGGNGVFCFNDGHGVNNSGEFTLAYSDMAKELASVHAGKAYFTVGGCCDSQTAVSPLSNEPYPVVAANIEPYWSWKMTDAYNSLWIGATISSKAFDLNGNGYVSVDEIIRTASPYDKFDPIIVSDKNNIAANLYLGDFSVQNQG